MEWLSWQFQGFLTLSEGTPILFSHADDLDDNESGELLRILTFLEIEDLHIVEGAVTVSVSPCIRTQLKCPGSWVIALCLPSLHDQMQPCVLRCICSKPLVIRKLHVHSPHFKMTIY